MSVLGGLKTKRSVDIIEGTTRQYLQSAERNTLPISDEEALLHKRLIAKWATALLSYNTPRTIVTKLISIRHAIRFISYIKDASCTDPFLLMHCTNADTDIKSWSSSLVRIAR